MCAAQSPALRIAALGRVIRRCTRCAALVRCRTRVVPGAGDAPALIALVGIAPGRMGGDRTGVPFSGDRSGDLLRQMIARSGLESVFITNLVRCNPRDARGRNRDPKPREIANCRAHLASELAIVRPRIIVCLGRMAWRELAGRDAPFRPAPEILPTRDDAILFPMYHPAYVNRGAYSKRDYLRDFRRLAAVAEALACATKPRAPGGLTKAEATAMLTR
ncbi:MAG TPA: uracil-DNA glycosylase [Candidatus Binataceae bacterium]|nr:uracil-DNA glycosylase [Candidatus Binataceae bacterium]